MSRAEFKLSTCGMLLALQQHLPALWVMLACALAGPAQALDCPRVPEQSNKDWEVEVKAAVGKLGPATATELATRIRSVTGDLLGKLPQADRVYLEQMMYASYCSALRDNQTLTEAVRETRIRAYNTELRTALREPPKSSASTAATDPRDDARKALARIPLDYTPGAFVGSVAQQKQAAALLFLKAGIDPDSVDNEGSTALMRAAGHGDMTILNALLGARADVNKRNRRGETALAWAAIAGHAEVVRTLLSRGANADSVNRAFVFSAELGRTETLLVLIDRVGDKGKATAEALRRAAASSFDNTDEDRLIEVSRLLLQRGADINAPDDNGWAALTEAVKSGRGQMVQLFIESGANVNHRCACNGWLSGGYTPLAMAADKNQPEIADLLLKAGADLNLPNHEGATPLMIAAANGSQAIVMALLAKGADPNAHDRNGNTALMNGAYRIVTARALLASGAVVDAKNGHGVTPLMSVVAMGEVEVAALLLDAGANVNAKNNAGRTPLMVAARTGRVDAARLLIKRGAQGGDTDEDERTALSYAEALAPGDSRTSLVALLKKAGTK